ncbi:MAG: galactokinase [Treponemataceae bacterium]|nr:MAG: galactokinase [Treponemataceae bacterium]
MIEDPSRFRALRDALAASGETAGKAVRFFSVPGRAELCGNHTDHNGGKALAVAVGLDALAAVTPRDDNIVFLRSIGRKAFGASGFPDVCINLTNLAPRANEQGTTDALLRGVAAGLAARGQRIGGWTAVMDNRVLPGSGLSSSAVVEVLAAKISDCLYSEGNLPAVELAKIAQKAENDYYGKPSGLMDQSAAAIGGTVAFDFGGAELEWTRFDFAPERDGYTLCVVNTGGNHASLTPHYAACAAEMREVAAVLGAENLRQAGRAAFEAAIADSERAAALRKTAGDRAILRAMHFFAENERVDAFCAAIAALNAAEGQARRGIFTRILGIVNDCADSSWELLGNCYPPDTPRDSGIPLALALTRDFARARDIKAACRLQGGGFAGTIQTYIPNEHIPAYTHTCEAVFGPHCVTPLTLRSEGAVELTQSAECFL